MTFVYTPPEPDTHCFDTDENKDVWSYSKYLHVAEVERVRRETIEECAKLCHSQAATRSNPDYVNAAIDCSVKIRRLLK